MKTYDDAIDEAIELLSKNTFAHFGDCSGRLIPCGGPTLTGKLYIAEIERLRGGSGDYADGLTAAINILETYGARRGGVGQFVLVKLPKGETDSHMFLFISRLQASLFGGK